MYFLENLSTKGKFNCGSFLYISYTFYETYTALHVSGSVIVTIILWLIDLYFLYGLA